MRITIAHYSCLPILGGVESVIGDHARLFAAHGHSVTLATRRGASPGDDCVPSARTARIGHKQLQSIEPAAVIKEFRALFADQDVVFAHNLLTMPFEPAWTAALWQLADELPAVRFISWVHDLAACNPDYVVAADSLLTRAHPLIQTVTVSELRRRQFLSLTGKESEVIPNGIEPDRILGLSPRILAFARAQRLFSRDLVLLQPARILRRKNIELSLRVTAEMLQSGHDCCLLVTGPPDAHQPAARAYSDEIRALERELGLENHAHFLQDHLGAIDDADLSSLYQIADALWFPSWQEGFGLPLLEAAVHRLPIFCSAIEPLQELAGATAQLLDPAAPPVQLARRVIETVLNSKEIQARKMVCRDYAWSAIYEKFLAPLLSKKHSPQLPMNNTTSRPTIHEGNLQAILRAEHGDPFSVLGMHTTEEQLLVRVFRPDAREVTVRNLVDDSLHPAILTNDAGFFIALIEGAPERFPYTLDFVSHEGHAWTERDPYSFGVQLGPLDLHLFAEGNHYELYNKLGAHLREVDGARGTAFHVWAPNAQRVSVVGDFNRWDGRTHAMRKLLGCGVWEIFIPGVEEGTHYKFEIKQAHGAIALKSDPFAFYNQHSTSTASLVFDLHRYQWSDAAWMAERTQKEWNKSPVSIYEVHLGSWQRNVEDGNRYLSYRELADTLLPYVVELGYTHLELLPVSEHPFDGSWGYQVTGYYAPTSRFGNPDEFRYFVDRCHQAGIGVILDWVPGHFPKDSHGLAEFDGTDLFEHSDPRQGEHKEWGTLIFNYGRNEVRNFLIANALFWFEQYHIDGLRVDAVASMLYLDYSREPGEWVPNVHGGRENLEAVYFLKRFNEVCYERFPGIMTIAEESTAWQGVSRPTYLGGLGFGFKWNMGWMHDFLAYMQKDPIHRRFHQGDITFSLIYAFQEHFMLVLSHDEVVHGKGALLDKMPGDVWQKFANLRLFYAWMFAHPGKKLLFMGGEFGQWREWNHDQSLDWHLTALPEHAGLLRLVQHLNWVYKNEPALYDQDDTYEGFEWIDFHDSDNSVVAFKRKSREGETLVFVINATPVLREHYRVGVNGEGWYEEIINTDAALYGGSNAGNFGGVHAEPMAWQGKSHSILLRLPPLGVLGFKRRANQ